jgi:thiamine biosynthesis lipoprotein
MRRRIFRLVSVTFLVTFFAVGASVYFRDGDTIAWEINGNYRKFSDESFDSFDTMVTFTAFVKDEAEFDIYAKIVRDEMRRLHRLFDIYNNYEGIANLKTVNDAAGVAPVTVDPSIVDLLEIAVYACGETEGAVNVALGPVLAVWHDHREAAARGEASVPSASELQSAAARISVRDILIDPERSTVFLRHDDMRLDVGAVAKGYAAGRAAELLRDAGLTSGLINAGGNVVVIGPPLDGRESWNIGVHAPTDDGDMSKLLDVLNLRDGAAVTSGSDQRYFTAGGCRYHHIIDPKTLFPAVGLKSVTILHADSTYADILSTAAFILQMDKARELISRHNAEALWVMDDGRTIMTEGYRHLSKMGMGEKNADKSAPGGER